MWIETTRPKCSSGPGGIGEANQQERVDCRQVDKSHNLKSVGIRMKAEWRVD